MAQPPSSGEQKKEDESKKKGGRRAFIKATLVMMLVGILAPAITLTDFLKRDLIKRPLPKVKIANTKDLEKGGYLIFFYPTSDADFRSILFRLGETDWTAYNFRCTHLGCPLRMIPGEENLGYIGPCPCHGSMFNIKDGTVHRGPALSPLPTIDLEIGGKTGDIYAVDLDGTPTIHGPGRPSKVTINPGE